MASNFDEMIDRRNTASLKWDVEENELPMWVADMEFAVAPEILQAIHNPLGVSTMTGIKYRPRAMMGGCQGGLCQMKIEHFIEQELGTEPENVRYSRQGSWVLTGNMRKEEN